MKIILIFFSSLQLFQISRVRSVKVSMLKVKLLQSEYTQRDRVYSSESCKHAACEWIANNEINFFLKNLHDTRDVFSILKLHFIVVFFERVSNASNKHFKRRLSWVVRAIRVSPEVPHDLHNCRSRSPSSGHHQAFIFTMRLSWNVLSACEHL